MQIADVKIKEITLAKTGETGEILSLGIWYSLVDTDGKEVAQKRDLISNDELQDETKRSYMTDLISFAQGVVKTREQM